jgi:hypothetical protein
VGLDCIFADLGVPGESDVVLPISTQLDSANDPSQVIEMQNPVDIPMVSRYENKLFQFVTIITFHWQIVLWQMKS